MTIEEFVSRLDRAKKSGRGYSARCPAHEDRRASLSVNEGDDGRILVKCHAGCEVEDVVARMGLEMQDLWPEKAMQSPSPTPRRAAERDTAPTGVRVADLDSAHSKTRARLADSPGTIARLGEIRGWTSEAIASLELGLDGDRVTIPVRDSTGKLVNLLAYAPNPERREGVKMLAIRGAPRDLFPAPEMVAGDPVWLVEGEPDAIAGTSAGLATVGVPGASTWRSEWAARFGGRRVVVCFDCDSVGREQALKLAGLIAVKATEVRLVDLDYSRDDGYDLSDLLRELGPEMARRLLAEKYQAADVIVPDGIRLLNFDSIERENVTWLVPGRVPLGMLTMIVGDPGLGKSMLTIAWAGELSRGELGAPGMTLLVNAEDSWTATIKPRLVAARVDFDYCRAVTKTEEGFEESLSIPDDVAKLEKQVRATKARMVIIDPINAHLPDRINSWRDQSVRRALSPLYRMAERQKCAVVVTAHLNKGEGSRAVHRIGGSIAFPGAARSVLLLAEDPDDPEGELGSRRVLAHIKCNVGRKQQSLVYRIEEILIPAANNEPEQKTAKIVCVGESRAETTTLLEDDPTPIVHRQEAVEFLRLELADGPVLTKELRHRAREAGISDRTLDRAKQSMGVRARKTEGTGAWEWYVPESPRDRAVGS